MILRSKALSFAVLVGVAFYGCSVGSGLGPKNDQSADNMALTQSEDSNTEASDNVDVASAAEAVRTDQIARAETDGLSVRRESTSQTTRLLVGTGTFSNLEVLNLSEPARLVVDLYGATTPTKAVSLTISDDTFVRSVRAANHDNKKTRLVFDLRDVAGNSTTTPSVSTEGEELVVTFTTGSAETAKAEEVAAPVQQKEELLTVDRVTFVKKSGPDAGRISIERSEDSAFQMTRTAPSEYVLTIPGAIAADTTKVPQIAPVGFPGIRSARAVQEGNDVQVRMFVDPLVELSALSHGKDIQVTVRNTPAGQDVRAQLEENGDSVPKNGEAAARENPTGIVSEDGSKIYTGRLISLDLQDTDIDNALRIIAEVSNLNIIASDDVTGKVTLRLIDVPWDQALDVILKTNGLDQVTEGNVIRIAPIDKLRAERQALYEAKQAAVQLEDLKVRYIRVSYARVTDVREAVEAVISERGSVTVDERTNQLIVKDIRTGQDEAAELIRKLDLRTPQVLLETQIVETSQNILRDLGFQWNYNYIASPETGNATGMNFPNTVGVGGAVVDGETGDTNLVNTPANLGEDPIGGAIALVLDSADGSRSLTARLSALETEGKAKVISRPQVATVNNKAAEIKSVETIRVRLPDSGLSVATGQGATASGGGSTAVEEIDVGIELRVTPQASPDYYVLLDVEAKSSTFSARDPVDGIPSTLEREATSTILVKSGETFALGGVYRINDQDLIQGIPFLKDLPFLGHIFRRTFTNKADEELIFFITPHIVEGSFDENMM